MSGAGLQCPRADACGSRIRDRRMPSVMERTNLALHIRGRERRSERVAWRLCKRPTSLRMPEHRSDGTRRSRPRLHPDGATGRPWPPDHAAADTHATRRPDTAGRAVDSSRPRTRGFAGYTSSMSRVSAVLINVASVADSVVGASDDLGSGGPASRAAVTGNVGRDAFSRFAPGRLVVRKTPSGLLDDPPPVLEELRAVLLREHVVACGTAASSRARATRPGEAARRRASLSPTPSPGVGRAGR